MTVEEFLIRMLAEIKPLAPAGIFVLGSTLVLTAAAAVMSRGFWVNHPQFRRLGLLFALSKGGCMRLACCWIKFLLLVFYLVQFQKLEALHYILFLVPCLLYAVSLEEPTRIPGRLAWIAVELLGLVSANMICGYYHEMRGEAVFLVVYVTMAIFMALFGCYLFLTEINDLSEGRSWIKEDA